MIKELEFASHKIVYRWLPDEINLVNDMPLEFKYQFLREMHPELVESPFFKTKDISFIVRIIDLLKPQLVKKGQFIWECDDPSDKIVFLSKGSLFLLVDNPFLWNWKSLVIPNNDQPAPKKSTFLYAKELIMRKNYGRENHHKLKADLLSVLYLKCLAFKLLSQSSYIGDEEIVF